MKFSEFWKTYRADVTKLLTTHFALSVFGILCASPFLIIQTAEVRAFACIAISTFTFIFYYYLVRNQMWTVGAKAKLSGKTSPLTGFYIGALASVPSLLFNIVLIVASIFRDYEGISSLYSVMVLTELVWDGEALGYFLVGRSPYVYLTASLLPILFSGLTFFLGTKEFSLFGAPRKEK